MENLLSSLKHSGNNENLLLTAGQLAHQSKSQLYDRYVQGLFEYGMHVCGNREVAMESLRRVFVQIYHKGPRVRDHRTFQIFIFREFRKLLQGDFDKAVSVPRARSMDLSPSQHEAIFLKFHKRFSYVEVATIMRINTESARDLVRKGIDRLYSQLSAHDNALHCIE
jgi:DNA-directed RNA polymerase specialized sigma24 family protein